MPTASPLHLAMDGATHVGHVREHNEDAYVVHPAAQLCGVADGMGGHAAGEVASAFACAALTSVAQATSPRDAARRFASVAEESHARCLHYAVEHPAAANLGCTLTALRLDGQEITLQHVGDSAAYRLRDGRLVRMTEAHTAVARMVRRGVITPEAAATHPARHMLDRCIGGGTHQPPRADAIRERARAGDRYLLATDGVTDMVNDATLSQLLAGTSHTPAGRVAAIQAIIETALAHGGRDNITAIIVDVMQGDA